MVNKVKQGRIEKKYEKIIAQVIEEYKNKSMEEFWAKLDEIKAQMGKELDGVK